MHNRDSQPSYEFTRRDFLKTTAFAGGCAALAAETSRVFAPRANAANGHATSGDYALVDPENILYSTCLQCHVDCQIKAKLWDGTLAKLAGSPYSPQNFIPHIPYDTHPREVVAIDGKLCPKGQAGIQTYYDPYRIRKVLKRAGPRGSGKWQTIEWDEFIGEVVKGGKLFADLGDQRHYPGFDEVCALRDPAVGTELAEDAAKVAAGEMTVEEFRKSHRDHLHALIDPDHPDLGPKNNQFIFDAGRIEHGRKELMKWFTFQTLGSVNVFEHTTICEQSHHIAYHAVTGGKTHHLKPDLANVEFVVFWGTGAFSANFGLTPMAEKVTDGKVHHGLRTAVIDPRMSHDAAKADFWLPVKPGADGALALAMIRWIIENRRYDARYLANANRAAAAQDGEPTWSNATHLVKIIDGHAERCLRADEAGLGSAEQMVVSRGGKLIAVDPESDSEPVEGDLFVDTVVNGAVVKSALQLLYEQAASRSWDSYVDITGIASKQIAAVANELTSHGKRAAVELYRGPVQHTDGYYAAQAIILLNVLIGNPDWRGGLAKGGGHWHESGGKEASRYNFKSMHPGALRAFGVKLTREGSHYEDSTLFREHGYPAKRPWYPFSGNVYQEVLPSFVSGYPYPGKILFLHKGTPILSVPAGSQLIADLQNPEKVPLFIACDIIIGETSMYADYIVPDLTYLERWATPHVTPDVNTKVSKVRQPVAKPRTEEVTIDGETMPICMEAFMIAVSKKLGLSGFGQDAFGPGMHFNRPEDWYLKLVANIAIGDKPGEAVPDAGDDELELFRRARRHLPSSVFDEKKWQATVAEDEWRKVVYVLNRGGRFAGFDTAYDGEQMHSKLGSMFHIFVEHVAEHKNSISGHHFSGVPLYRGPTDASGQRIEQGSSYPLALITFKEPFGGHSRTISNYWGNLGLQRENKLWINRADAFRLGIKPDQLVRLISASNPEGKVDLGDGRTLDMVLRAQVMEGMRPGVVGVSWHYGHWAYGSHDVVVDGKTIRGDRRRAAGLCPNPLLLVDPILKDVCLTDPIGASASFYDTKVSVIPI